MAGEIEIGGSFSNYRIVSKIGEGGMGEVYLAEDTELGRQVALKVLLSEVADDDDRVRRFVQEAKAASALNHPNILTVYQIGEFENSRFIATELIKGETLRDRLRGWPITLREVLDVAMQVAAALNAAHNAGIVHRDIKPENIMLRDDGIVKVLDFGLAKLVAAPTASADSEDATRAQVNTRPGVVMGTVVYMSPEQARGKETDARSDVWSLGVVMYEMLTKQTPFAGETTSDSIAAILTKEPLPLEDDTPSELRRIVRKSLQKPTDERYQTVKDLLLDVKNLKRELEFTEELERSHVPNVTGSSNVSTGQMSDNATAIHSGRISTQTSMPQQLSSAEYLVSQVGRHKAVFAIAALIILGLIAGGGYLAYQRYGGTPVATASQLKISRLVTGLGDIGNASISPDGKYVAYQVTVNGKTSLHVRQVSTGSDREIVSPVEEGVFRATVFSADSELVYYNFYHPTTNPLGTLYQIPVIGGREPKKILDHLSLIIGFAPDGKRFAFIRDYPKTGDSALVVASIDGGEPREIARRTGQDWFNGIPAFSPDGRSIICPVGTDTGGTQFTLAEIPVDGGPERLITSFRWRSGLWRPLWLNDGTGIMVNGQDHPTGTAQIWRVSYPGGAVTRVTNDLTQYGTSSFGMTADSSTIVSIAAETTSKVMVVTPNEEETKARKLTNGSKDGIEGLDWTADGRILYTARTGDDQDVWITNSDGTGLKQLTANRDIETGIEVSPDGRHIVFAATGDGSVAHIFRMEPDGGNVKQLTQGEYADFQPIVSPDGAWVYFGSWRTGNPRLWKVGIDGGEPVQATQVPFNGAGFLPDGKSMFGSYFDEQVSPPRQRSAIMSMESGEIAKVFDLPKKATGWSMPDQRTVIYKEARDSVDNLWTVPVDGGTPKQLTKFTSEFIYNFKFSRDGKRIAVARGVGSADIILIKGFR